MQVSDAAGQLLELMVFAMFGSYAVIVGWRDADWRVVRLRGAWRCSRCAWSRCRWRCSAATCRPGNRLFIGWFGPRGIGTLVLGLLMVERGEIEQEALITQVVVVAVTLSLVLHSLTAWPGIRWPGFARAETPARTPP